MKVKSVRELEAYIYSSFILPFKGYGMLSMDTPITGKDGRNWIFGLYQRQINGNLRRNYQRTQARRNRDWYFGMSTGDSFHIIGEYNVKNRWVKLYELPFKRNGAMILLGKIYEVLDRDSLFTKVIIHQGDNGLYGIDDAFRQYDSHSVPNLERNDPNISPSVNPYRDEEPVDEDEEGAWDD